MTEVDVETILQRARERYPEERPRIITDNATTGGLFNKCALLGSSPFDRLGPLPTKSHWDTQFIAKDFKQFIRLAGMTHVKTSPFYPQSNGKIERWHGSLKRERIRPGTPLSLDDARRLVDRYVQYYNHVRLHSGLGYIAPADRLAGRQADIFHQRDRKLEEARQRRKAERDKLRQHQNVA